MSAHECAYQNRLQKYIFFCKYTIVQTKSHLIKTKYHLAAEPAAAFFAPHWNDPIDEFHRDIARCIAFRGKGLAGQLPAAVEIRRSRPFPRLEILLAHERARVHIPKSAAKVLFFSKCTNF